MGSRPLHTASAAWNDRMKIQHGNVLNISQGIVVHGCNAQGQMNSGIAGEIHQRFLSVYEDYHRCYTQGALVLGSVIYSPPNTKENRGFWVANGITQEFYGRDPHVRYVDYVAIRHVFKNVYEHAKKMNLDVNFPKIGAGLANGSWDVISQIISQELKDVPHTLWLHENAQPL